ncbi:MAG: type IV conjugative transfer system protein TraE [Desulfobulbaceae bacterium]
MRTSIYLQKASNLFVENRLLKSVIVVMALAVAFNSLLVYRAVRYQRVVLIPPQMTGTVEFVQGRPTDTYIRDMSRRIVNLAATYSPPTARAQFEELLFHYAPEAYPEASRSWYSLAGRVEESQVSSAFYPEKISVTENTIEVFGKLTQFAGNTKITEASKAYLIEYQVRDGRFYVLAFKEKSETQPFQPEEENK